MTQPDRPLELFISYSHEDETLRQQLEKHLIILRRRGMVSVWTDRKIPPGADWAGEIDERLNTADVILALISASFVASNYCYENELARAIERHKKDEAVLIPIIIRPCVWEGAPFSKIQALPQDGRAVTSWGNLDEAYTLITEEILRLAGEKLKAVRSPSTAISRTTRTIRSPSLLPYL